MAKSTNTFDLKEYLSERHRIPHNLIVPEANLFHDLNLTEYDLKQVLEQAGEAHVSEDEVRKIKTVGDLEVYLQ
ncbi:hypothetical protein CMI37_38165 [Candidatus Pacearchaeota archaeon]|nr:hypothetical protein [Candidatus Pacearchaeota archaeon]|tara:strand:+ start:671 stop:892 length:222 start_codon:yes stop_codon:yes gene_type:complete